MRTPVCVYLEPFDCTGTSCPSVLHSNSFASTYTLKPSTSAVPHLIYIKCITSILSYINIQRDHDIYKCCIHQLSLITGAFYKQFPTSLNSIIWNYCLGKCFWHVSDLLKYLTFMSQNLDCLSALVQPHTILQQLELHGWHWCYYKSFYTTLVTKLCQNVP